MFSMVYTVFLPFISTLFIFLYCDIFLLVKVLVINEGANPDLRKHTWTHILHALQLHWAHRIEFSLQKTKPIPVHHLNSPLGHKTGLNAAEPFYFKQTEMRWPVAQFIAPQSLGLQSNSNHYPVGEREPKLKSEESLVLKENVMFACFTVSAFENLPRFPDLTSYTCKPQVWLWYPCEAELVGGINWCSSYAIGP